MIKICIEDLSECEALDKEHMGRIRGGHSFCGTPLGPLSGESVFGSLMNLGSAL